MLILTMQIVPQTLEYALRSYFSLQIVLTSEIYSDKI